MVAKVPKANQVDGLIATLAEKIKKQVVKLASLVEDKKAKKEQSIHLADQLPVLAERKVEEKAGVKNLLMKIIYILQMLLLMMVP